MEAAPSYNYKVVRQFALMTVVWGIIGMAVGRIGDIINGEHFAKTTDLFWGVI